MIILSPECPANPGLSIIITGAEFRQKEKNIKENKITKWNSSQQADEVSNGIDFFLSMQASEY